MHPSELKPGDVYILPKHRGSWNGIRHLVLKVDIESHRVRYRLLDVVYNSTLDTIYRDVAYEGNDMFLDLIAWEFKVIRTKKNHLPEWL